MDFAHEWTTVHSFLDEHAFRSAVIGGVALAAYGHPRLTLDLDIVTDASAQAVLIPMMESRGFSTLHRSPGYSNHRHSDRAHGRVDFMYVRDTTADRIFSTLRHMPGPGDVTLPVPRPEYLIAMKVRAIAEAPERRLQDLADIGYLARLPGVDRSEVRGFFEQAGLGADWHDIEQLL